jgi:hypothetical protein
VPWARVKQVIASRYPDFVKKEQAKGNLIQTGPVSVTIPGIPPQSGEDI